MSAESVAREILAAGLGCAIADSLFNSLNVLKVRQQLEPSGESTAALARRILRTEGIGALALPGMGATQLRGMTYTGFRIGAYPEAKRRIETISGCAGDSFTVRASAGLTTGHWSALHMHKPPLWCMGQTGPQGAVRRLCGAGVKTEAPRQLRCYT